MYRFQKDKANDSFNSVAKRFAHLLWPEYLLILNICVIYFSMTIYYPFCLQYIILIEN